MEKILNSKTNILPQIISSKKKEIQSFLRSIKGKYNFSKIEKILSNLYDTKVLIIGDIIIDIYDYVIPKGRAIKDPILSCDFLKSEKFAGGILAISNHLSNFVENIKLFSIIGDTDDNLVFIKDSLNKNINFEYFIKNNSYTTIKKRFINKQRKEKLFKIEMISDDPISNELSDIIKKRLQNLLAQYDLIVVGDFGHGFLDQNLIDVLEEQSPYMALNVQTNSANLGFNLVTKYTKSNFISLDNRELQYAVHNQFDNWKILTSKLQNKINFQNLLVTMGKNGLRYYTQKKEYYNSPAFPSRVEDTVGAGDAVFSIASLLDFYHIEPDLLCFLSSCAGALAVQSMGNKVSLSIGTLLEYVHEIYK